jgi:putative tryptophan/tyrosine transport system substrate-binding protein
MNIIARSIVAGLATCVLLCVGCDKPSGTSREKSASSKSVGVLILASHPVLHDLRDGFREKLDELAKTQGIELAFDEKNAEGNAATLNQLVAYFSNGKHDLVYAVGSDSALKLKSKESRTAVIFAGTPDPVRNGFVDSLEKPGSNLTGVRFLPPAHVLLDVLTARHPSIRRIAVLRNPSEINSKCVAEPFIAEAAKRGITIGDFGVTEISQLPAVLGKISSEKWECVFIPNDNLVYQNLKQVAASLASSGIPFISVTDSSVKAGADFAVGVSYRDMGRQAASVAAQVLFDGKNPSDVPVLDLKTGCLFVPAKTVHEFGAVALRDFPVTPVP